MTVAAATRPGPAWVVEVNEIRLNASGSPAACSWWHDWQMAMGRRCAVVRVCLGGAEVEVACHTRGEAAALQALLIEHGLPRQALKTRRGGGPAAPQLAFDLEVT